MFLTTKTKNRKIGDIAATYLPIKQTCPNSCALKDNGCYAQVGYVGMWMMKLEAKMAGVSAYDIIRKEAREIAAYGPYAKGKILRLHVSGDARTTASVKLLAAAEKKWDGKVYTYTHAWRNVPRKAWGKISILASCESTGEAKEALKKGYAPALTVAFHPGDKAYMQDGLKIIPCPQQTRGVTCDKCRLCMNDAMLRDQSAVISFAVHGVRKKRALTVIQ
jgi:hypothetical protein